MDSAQHALAPKWHKSTYSANQGECVEVAENLPNVVLVRDTKDQEAGPVLRYSVPAWSAFLGGLKDGEFSRQS